MVRVSITSEKLLLDGSYICWKSLADMTGYVYNAGSTIQLTGRYSPFYPISLNRSDLKSLNLIALSHNGTKEGCMLSIAIYISRLTRTKQISCNLSRQLKIDRNLTLIYCYD